MYISICVQGLKTFLKFFGSKFQPGDCSQLVLNFWTNLSLGVLIKFVLIKKRSVYAISYHHLYSSPARKKISRDDI